MNNTTYNWNDWFYTQLLETLKGVKYGEGDLFTFAIKVKYSTKISHVVEQTWIIQEWHFKKTHKKCLFTHALEGDDENVEVPPPTKIFYTKEEQKPVDATVTSLSRKLKAPSQSKTVKKGNCAQNVKAKVAVSSLSTTQPISSISSDTTLNTMVDKYVDSILAIHRK